MPTPYIIQRVFHNSKISKNALCWWLKYSNLCFKTAFGFLLTWVLLVSQTVRQYNHWACIPSDSLGWKRVSSEPMEDELFMLVYSVSSSCTSFRSHQCILNTRPVAQVTSFLPSAFRNVSRLQQHSKKIQGRKPKKRNQNQGWNQQGSVLMGVFKLW